MKTFLLLLTLFAFLQSAFLPVNLVLVLLVARSLVTADRDNLFLAFFGGLILSFLSQVNLGYYSLIFILMVKLGNIVRKLPISINPLTIFLAGGLLVLVVAFFNKVLISQNLDIYPHLVEAFLVVPIFYLTQIWEERFTVKSGIRLKI